MRFPNCNKCLSQDLLLISFSAAADAFFSICGSLQLFSNADAAISIQCCLRFLLQSMPLSALAVLTGLQASKQARQQLLAAVHPHACDDTSSIAQDALQAVKNILQCSKLEAKGIAESSGAAAALQGFKQNLKSHISSICHVETHIVEDVKCRRDLLQMCNDIESMPCMSEQQTSESAGRTDPGHEEL